MSSVEVNFDGLVGPTHNYSGLSPGNLPSMTHKGIRSNPKKAALQGLKKMKFVHDLGVPQALLPPHERPHFPTLRKLGYKEIPDDLLPIVMSASPMWTANAFVSAPSEDTIDGKLRFVVANLSSELHRSIEAEETKKLLDTIFFEKELFAVEGPLPGIFPDEGAANHTRLKGGVHLFVYGKSVLHPQKGPQRYPARQSIEASKGVAQILQVEHRSIFLQQTAEAIDAGVFHNDVIATGAEELFFYHQKSFVSLPEIKGIQMIKVDSIPLETAVKTYLFNSQILNRNVFLAAEEVTESERVMEWIDKTLPPLGITFQSIDLRESMQNGGGPACLRNRVVMTKEQIKAMRGNLMMNDSLYEELVQWVNHHYRDSLTFEDLRDPMLHRECQEALDELTQILRLGSIYDFQR